MIFPIFHLIFFEMTKLILFHIMGFRPFSWFFIDIWGQIHSGIVATISRSSTAKKQSYEGYFVSELGTYVLWTSFSFQTYHGNMNTKLFPVYEH